MKYFVDTSDGEYTDVTYEVTVEDHISSDGMWSTSIILSIPYRQRVFFCAPGGCGAHSVSQIKMGHRAIVAYERTDGTYSLHYSHRGAFEYRLRETIGATNPFGEGSNEIWATETIERIRAGDPIEHNPLKEQSGSTSVDPMPRGSAASLEEIANSVVNYLHYEAVYIVSMDWDVEVWIPLWAGLTYNSSRVTTADIVGNGVLVASVDQNPVCVDHRDLPTKWAITKEVLGDGLDNNWISPDEAATYLRSKVTEWTRPNTDLLFSKDWSIGSMISD